MGQGVRDANPYLTSLSSFLGYSVFGAQGVLLGPLIMCLATLIYGGLGFLGNSMAQVKNVGIDLKHRDNALQVPPTRGRAASFLVAFAEYVVVNSGGGRLVKTGT